MTQLFKQPALLVLDAQIGFDDPYWGKRNNPDAEDNIVKLLTTWRKKKWEIIYSQHLSMDPKSPLHYKSQGTEFKAMLKPIQGEAIFQKSVNSAFIGTKLETYLQEKKIQSVVITGFSTQHCVSTTTRMSGNLGYETYLVSDGTAAYELTDHEGTYYPPEAIHNHELATLHKEFATIVTTIELIKQIGQSISN
ncbi:cysteine hydrolase family protein [Metabacillus malikii]|uniref:Nicotinamidase-related amidase n=1 Tax=Metabacillus malikii TaxID=1504265 RepID=A0ABT9ZFP0_9BACI|nr:cysteine hydrolase family protein [Metabacillus malikii]MDQ0230075.1 nicotinamidase-related amidase [Metabacillus malikii]